MFISNAYAQAAAQPSATSSLLGLLPMVVLFVALYFIMIRPQMKRAKEHQAMVNALAKGDEIVTGGGIAGKIVQVQDGFVRVAIADNVEVMVQKNAITTVLPKGSLKNG